VSDCGAKQTLKVVVQLQAQPFWQGVQQEAQGCQD